MCCAATSFNPHQGSPPHPHTNSCLALVALVQSLAILYKKTGGRGVGSVCTGGGLLVSPCSAGQALVALGALHLPTA